MTQDWCTSASLEILQQRARLLAAVRAFFASREVMELETPLLARHAVSELHIDSMAVDAGDAARRYLGTSPEYCMKRFLAEHRRPVYQVCKCFRAGECSPTHNPEFSMLEWYRPGYSLAQLMTETESLLQACAEALGHEAAACRRVSYRELFQRATGLDPHLASSLELRTFASDLPTGLPVGLGAGATDAVTAEIEKNSWLDWLMSSHVSQQLEADVYTFIYDYPASQAALAVIEPAGEQPVARRVELYYGALELANGYDELTDAAEQARRFAADNQRRALEGKPAVAADPLLLAAMESGLPPGAGIAIGLDRLLMVLTGVKNISQVLSYDYTKV